jgi:hypothetical protein
MSSDAQWCGQCYAIPGRATPVAAAPPAFGTPGGSIMTRQGPAAPTLAPTVVRSRWRKTQTTFGPFGRVVATVGLVLPEVFFVYIGIKLFGFTVFGAVIWGFIIMPWGLRDVWRAGQVPVG